MPLTTGLAKRPSEASQALLRDIAEPAPLTTARHHHTPSWSYSYKDETICTPRHNKLIAINNWTVACSSARLQATMQVFFYNSGQLSRTVRVMVEEQGGRIT